MPLDHDDEISGDAQFVYASCEGGSVSCMLSVRGEMIRVDHIARINYPTFVSPWERRTPWRSVIIEKPKAIRIELTSGEVIWTEGDTSWLDQGRNGGQSCPYCGHRIDR